MNTKKLIGKIISDKMAKTRVVAIDEKRRHPLYHRTFVVTTKISAHDEKNETKNGDMVEIAESRPISKNKAWRITRKIS